MEGEIKANEMKINNETLNINLNHEIKMAELNKAHEESMANINLKAKELEMERESKLEIAKVEQE